jgi:5'-3' exonuclease
VTVLRLVDGRNFLRRRFEKLSPGDAVREALHLERLHPHDVILWCWDSPTATKARRSIYPRYKNNRPPTLDSFNDMVRWVRDLLKHTRAFQTELSDYEADDLIAYFANKSERAHIVSNDQDLTQLVRPGVTIDCVPKIGPRWVRLYKTTVGDSSDNIGGVPGFGQKSWDAIGPLVEFDKIIRCRVRGQPMYQTWVDTLRDFGLAKKSIDFISDADDELVALWAITGPLPLRTDPPILTGTPNWPAVAAELNRFLL